jgi:hypothetical protein
MVSRVIAVMLAIRVMIVLHSFTAGTLPVAGVILLSVVMRPHPESSFIWRAAPVAGMPPVMAADRIPVTFNIGISNAGAGPTNLNPERRGCPDVYTDRHTAKHRSGR